MQFIKNLWINFTKSQQERYLEEAVDCHDFECRLRKVENDLERQKLLPLYFS
jgi:hypothetical protein